MSNHVGHDFIMFFKQKNFLQSCLSSGLTIHSCYIPKCSESNCYGCLDRAPSVQNPSGRRLRWKHVCVAGFSETLSEKFPTILPCSNNITWIITAWFLKHQQVKEPSLDTLLRPALDIPPHYSLSTS